MANKKKWLYKAKSPYIKAHRDWKFCSIKEKERLEKQFPNIFEFKENKPPEPTPSMKEEQ